MKKILILDDDLTVLHAFGEAIKYKEIEIKIICDTTGIFDYINDFKPDVILIDYILSGINGGEWCRLIKANPETNHIRVVITSAYSKVLHSLGHYGFDAFIEKPYDLETLVTIIKGFLRNSAEYDR